MGVFGKKTIPWVNGFYIGNFGGGNNGGDVQITVETRGRADTDRLVGEAHVQRFAVRLGINGHRLDVHFTAGADHAQGNFTAIGY